MRDKFRELGWKADRVPASGASQGFKGDVVVSKDGLKYVVEVKLRDNKFKSLYEYIYKSEDVILNNTLHCSTNLSHIVDYDGVFWLEFGKVTEKLVTRLLNLKKNADILVIKDNNKPLVYIRQYGRNT